MIMRRTSANTLTRPQRKQVSRAGVAVLELACVAPLLVYLSIGMLEVARGMQVKEALTDAARKGCRTGILPTGTNSTVTSDITSVLTNNSIPTANATITILVNGNQVDVSTAAANTPISVQVSIPYSSVAAISGFFLTGKSIESEKIIMMSQR